MQQQVYNIVKELAKKYKLPIQVVELIITTQFKSVRKFIEEDRDAVIMLPKWGKYITSQTKVKRIETFRKKKLDNAYQSKTL